jgi:hypothetical protein
VHQHDGVRAALAREISERHAAIHEAALAQPGLHVACHVAVVQQLLGEEPLGGGGTRERHGTKHADDRAAER